MTDPMQPSFLARLGLRWRRRAAGAQAGASPPAPSARSSLFHLRMEQRHRAHYQAARQRDAGPPPPDAGPPAR